MNERRVLTTGVALVSFLPRQTVAVKSLGCGVKKIRNN